MKEDVKEKERSYGSIMIERLTGSEDGRIDHVLQVTELVSTLPYIFLLSVLDLLH